MDAASDPHTSAADIRKWLERRQRNAQLVEAAELRADLAKTYTHVPAGARKAFARELGFSGKNPLASLKYVMGGKGWLFPGQAKRIRQVLDSDRITLRPGRPGRPRKSVAV